MGKSLFFYYFGPLISFWFITVYITMGIFSKHNKNGFFVITKMCVMSMITCYVINVSPIFQSSFDSVNTIFGTTWDSKEFLFHLSLDQWIVYTGMISAFVANRYEDNWDKLSRTTIAKMWLVGIILSVVCIFIWLGVQYFLEEKLVYNKYHSVISIPIVLGFVLLRNCTKTLRSRSIKLCSWMGNFSLESFVLQ
jgi:small-conductance mechanosensitive channel